MAIIALEPLVFSSFYEFLQVMQSKGRIISYVPILLRPEEDTIIMAQIYEIVHETQDCACVRRDSKDKQFRFYGNIIDEKGRDTSVKVRCILVNVGDRFVQPEFNDIVAMKNPFCFAPIPQEPTMQNDYENFWFVKNVPKLDTALPYNQIWIRNDLNNVINDDNDSLLNISVEVLTESEDGSADNQVVPQNIKATIDSNVASTESSNELNNTPNINRIQVPVIAVAGRSNEIPTVSQSSENNAFKDAITKTATLLVNENTDSLHNLDNTSNDTASIMISSENKNLDTNVPTATCDKINIDFSGPQSINLQSNKKALGACTRSSIRNNSQETTNASTNSSTSSQSSENQNTCDSDVTTFEDCTDPKSNYNLNQSNSMIVANDSSSVFDNTKCPQVGPCPSVRLSSDARLLLDDSTSQESIVTGSCSYQTLELIAPHKSLIISNRTTSPSSVVCNDTLKLCILYKACYKSKKVKFYSKGSFTKASIKSMLSDNVALGYCKNCKNLYNYYHIFWVTNESVNYPYCGECGVQQKLKIFFYCPLKLELEDESRDAKETIDLYFYSEGKHNLFEIDPVDFAYCDRVRSDFRFLVYSKVMSLESSLIPYWLYHFENTIIPFCFEKLE